MSAWVTACLQARRRLVYNAAMPIPRRFDGHALFAILLSIFAVAPLLNPGYFWGAHDARHSVYFLLEFDRSIQDGILYPRWQAEFNFGYGYPFFNIYSPLTTYLGEIFHLLGMDIVSAVKAVFALSFALSALTMYLYARRILGSRNAALVAATVYVYVPYHLADIFLRGALADSFCFVFFPLVLWGFHHLVERPGRRALVLAGAALAGLIFTHYTLALLFLPFLGLYIVMVVSLSSHRLRNLRQGIPHAGRTMLWAAGGGIYAVALSAILVLPVAFEFRFVRTDQWAGGYYNYRDHFVYPFQFFAPTWGYGPGSVAGPNDTLPFQLGAVAFVLSALSSVVLLLLRRSRRRQEAVPFIVFYQVATLGLMLLMLDVSLPLWEIFRLATFAQFPWRLLSLTTLTTAVLSGTVLLADEQRPAVASFSPVVALLAVVILGSYNYLQPQIIAPPEGPVSLAGLMRFEQSSGEMTGMTSYATRPRPPSWSPLADVYVSGGIVTDKVMREKLDPGVQVVTTRHSSVLDEVKVRTPQDTVLSFYTAYYPGWQATVDNKPVTITPAGDLGYITVPVPAGEHTIVLHFGQTPPRTVGAILSLLSLIVGLILVRRP